MADIYDLADALALARRRAPAAQHEARERYAQIFSTFERNPGDYGVDVEARPEELDRTIGYITARWQRPEAEAA